MTFGRHGSSFASQGETETMTPGPHGSGTPGPQCTVARAHGGAPRPGPQRRAAYPSIQARRARNAADMRWSRFMSPGPKESSGWMWKAPGTSQLLLATPHPPKSSDTGPRLHCASWSTRCSCSWLQDFIDSRQIELHSWGTLQPFQKNTQAQQDRRWPCGGHTVKT